jgi:hypothetical protein
MQSSIPLPRIRYKTHILKGFCLNLVSPTFILFQLQGRFMVETVVTISRCWVYRCVVQSKAWHMVPGPGGTFMR